MEGVRAGRQQGEVRWGDLPQILAHLPRPQLSNKNVKKNDEYPQMGGSTHITAIGTSVNGDMPEHVGQTRQSQCFNYMRGSETDIRSSPKMTRRDMALENGHETSDWGSIPG